MNTADIIQALHNTPILFIGSGISRRYLDLPNWDGLLEHFAQLVRSDKFAYGGYKNKAQQDMPLTASLIEADFNKKWFANAAFRTVTNEEWLEQISTGDLSPFKAEMAEYIKSFDNFTPNYEKEILKLKQLSTNHLSGIITTNYDRFVEYIAPAYQVYVGQQELVFSSLQEIGEIYKIHGSIATPSSIVINQQDYNSFKKHCAYLSSKLLILFMEYPIIFIGYSVSDEDIRAILSNIAECLTPAQLDELKHRLIFIEHNHQPGAEEISTHSLAFGDKTISMTKISLYDYSVLYDALTLKKRALPVQLLRMFKNEFYHYAISNDPKSCVMQVASIDDPRVDSNDLMIAIGKRDALAPMGLTGLKADAMYTDILLDDLKFDADQILSLAYPEWSKGDQRLPVFKYLNKANRKYPDIEEHYNFPFDELFLTKSIIKSRDYKRAQLPEKTVSYIIKLDVDDGKKLFYLCVLYPSELDIDDLHEYLVYLLKSDKDIFISSTGNVNLKTNFRRMIRIYDWLKNGNKKGNP